MEQRNEYIALGIFLIAIALAACSAPATEPFQGTVLKNSDLAMPFQLHNQFDQPVSLSDYDDKVVLLTFLYTNCTDVCPIVTSQLRDAHRALGDAADQVSVVAISVDPERDTVTAARDYLERWNLLHEWDFLVGDRQELSEIWRAYYISPAVDDLGRETRLPISQPTSYRRGGVGALEQAIAERSVVIHSAPVFLIDREGKMRVVFTSPLEPQAIAHDLSLLLK